MKTTVITLFITTLLVITITLLIRMLSPYLGPANIKIFTSGGVLVSLDGGSGWIESSAKDGTFDDLRVNDWEYFEEGGSQKILIATNTGVFISSDLGLTFERSFKDAVAGIVFDAAIAASQDAPTYFIAVKNTINSKAAMLKSDDGGASFQEIFSLDEEAGDIISVALNSSNPQMILGLTSGGLFLQSTNGGSTWARSDIGEGAFSELVVHPHNPNILFARAALGLFRSTDGGVSWQDITNIVIRDTGISQINDLHISSASTGGVFIAGPSGIWRSVNTGDSFKEISFILPARSVTLTAITTSPASASTLFVGASEKVYKSTDGGRSWKVVTAAERGAVQFLSVDPQNSDIVHAGVLR